MSSRARRGTGVFLFLGFALLVGMVSTAQATLIADWQFTEGNFLADSAGSNTLTKVGTVGDTGGVATFSNAGLLTAANLDLSGYNKIRISWRWLIQTDAFGSLYNTDNFNSAGALAMSVNELAAGDNYGGLRGTSGGYIVDRFSHEHGTTNTTWENFYAEYDLTAADVKNVVQVFEDGSLVSTSPHTAGVPSAFVGGLFQIGGGSNDGGLTFSGAGMIGQLDYLTIESIPEPGMMTLLLTGILGLLAYAWRRRRA